MLEMYKDQIGAAASVLTIIQMLSPIFICVEFIRKKSTKDIDMMPFLGGLVLTSLFIIHGNIVGDQIMLNVNLVGFVLNSIYITLYYAYTVHKMKFWIKMGKATAFIAILLGYVIQEDSQVVELRFGLIITVIFFAFVSAPLLNTSTILKTRNTDSLPIPLILSGVGLSIIWFLYGVSVNDIFIVIQNVVAIIIQGLQLALYLHVKCLISSKKDNRKSKKNE